MHCQFIPHSTPGRFLCTACKIPSSRNKIYGTDGPPPRHCNATPPEVSTGDVSIDWYDQPLVVVVGTHRSLSSCLAECLESLGVYMGQTKGGEDQPMATLLESLMPFPSTEKLKTFAERVELIRARLLVIRKLAGDKPVGIKYPHLCEMMEELQAAWPDLRIIHTARPLAESIESLVTRSAKDDAEEWTRADRQQCETLQAHLFDAKEEWLSGYPHLTVVADDLLHRQSETIDRVADYLEPVGLTTTEERRTLAWHRVNPGFAVHSSNVPQFWLDDTTIIIKAHERPDCLDDLIRSIHRFYPSARILVGDDSRHPAERSDVTVHRLPYDVGLSAGRNYLVSQVETPYVLLLDDDFVFTADTDIQQLHDGLASADVVAGRTTCWKERPLFVGHFALDDDVLHMRPGPVDAEALVPEYHVVENFFLASCEALRKAPWDNRLKVGEHIDWCLRAKDAGLRLSFMPDVTIVDQSPQMPDGVYHEHRKRARMFRDMALTEWSRRLGFRRFNGTIGPNVIDIQITADQPDPLPPTITQVENFIDAMWKFGRSGCQLASKEERRRRIDICMGCEQFLGGRCRKCGCCGKLKTAGKVWTCPLGKWAENPPERTPCTPPP